MIDLFPFRLLLRLQNPISSINSVKNSFLIICKLLYNFQTHRNRTISHYFFHNQLFVTSRKSTSDKSIIFCPINLLKLLSIRFLIAFIQFLIGLWVNVEFWGVFSNEIDISSLTSLVIEVAIHNILQRKFDIFFVFFL